MYFLPVKCSVCFLVTAGCITWHRLLPRSLHRSVFMATVALRLQSFTRNACFIRYLMAKAQTPYNKLLLVRLLIEPFLLIVRRILNQPVATVTRLHLPKYLLQHK